MASAKFAVNLSCARGTPHVESTSYEIVLSQINPKDEKKAIHKCHHLEKIPFHFAADVTAATQPDCFLQVWELDEFKTERYLQDEEADVLGRKNQIIATFAGVVVKQVQTINGKAVTTTRFQPTEPPELVQKTLDPYSGQITLSLLPAGKTAPQDAQAYAIPLAEYEAILELAVTVRTKKDDKVFESEKAIPPFRVRNVKASVLREIKERGGIAVAFVANYRKNKNDQTSPPKPDKYAKKGDQEFECQAEEAIAVLPTFLADGNNVKTGFTLINSWQEIAPLLPGVRTAAKALVPEELKKELGLEGAREPLIATLAIYCHGMRYSLLLRHAGTGEHLDIDKKVTSLGPNSLNKVSAFVDAIKDHVAPGLVLPIFACSTGRGWEVRNEKSAKVDPSYGHVHPCAEPGGDSVAWHLYRELKRKGVSWPTVWAHTTAAHTTRNCRLRAFSAFGSADLANLLKQAPRLGAGDNNAIAYTRPFAHDTDGLSRSDKRKRLHNSNLVRAISLHSALYLPWTWTGSSLDPAKVPFFNAAARERAKFVYDELATLTAGVSTASDEVTYEPGRAFVTGLQVPDTDADLSEDFTLGNLMGLPPPAGQAAPPSFRLKVQLMRSVQMLRYRFGRSISITTIEARGEAAHLVPGNPHKLSVLQDKATQMAAEGIFSAVTATTSGVRVTHTA